MDGGDLIGQIRAVCMKTQQGDEDAEAAQLDEEGMKTAEEIASIEKML